MNRSFAAQCLWTLWMCLCALLVGLTAAASNRIRAHSRGFMNGLLLSAQLLLLLPQAAFLCSYPILILSFTLGIIMSIFWRSATSTQVATHPSFAWSSCLFLFCCGMLGMSGWMALPVFWIYLPIGVFLFPLRPIKWLPILLMAMGSGMLCSLFFPPSPRIGGMLFAISCGMTLQMTHGTPEHWGPGWTGGLVAGMLLSAF